MAGSPDISVDVTALSGDTFSANTYSIGQAIATGKTYPENGSIEVRIMNGKDKNNESDDIRHLMKPQLTLSFQVMDSSGTSPKGEDPPNGWASWFECAFNDDTSFSAAFNVGVNTSSNVGTSGAIPIKSDGQSSLNLTNTSDQEKACIYGSVKKSDGNVPAANERYCTFKFRLKPPSSTGAGNYQYILKISGIYT